VQTLTECRGLYNTMLAERKDTYEQTGKSPSLYAQINRFPELKKENPALREVHSQVLQNVAVRIDLAFGGRTDTIRLPIRSQDSELRVIVCFSPRSVTSRR